MYLDQAEKTPKDLVFKPDWINPNRNLTESFSILTENVKNLDRVVLVISDYYFLGSSNYGREDQVYKRPIVGNRNPEIRQILPHRIFKRSSEDDNNSKRAKNSTDEKTFIFNLKKNECVEVTL